MKTYRATFYLVMCTILLFSGVCQAQDIKLFRAEEVKPIGNTKEKTADKEKRQTTAGDKASVSYFLGLYHYWVPGTSYTVPDYANKREVIRTSAGTGVLPGSIRIDANGTYTWNSSWDGKIIKGNWRLTGDTGYPIELVKAQEGKSWRVGKSNEQGVSIIIWDGSTWYNGRKVKGTR